MILTPADDLDYLERSLEGLGGPHVVSAGADLAVQDGARHFRLAHAGGSVVLASGYMYWGDLDGDGQPDLLVGVYEAGRPTGTYVVSPPRVHAPVVDPAVSGIRIETPHEGVLSHWIPAGDQNHDGRADLAAGATIYSITFAPGRAPARLRTVRTLPGDLQTMLIVPGSATPVPIIAIPSNRTTPARLEVLDPAHDRLLPPPGARAVSAASAVTAYSSSSHDAIVQETLIPEDNSDATVWRWDLGRACAR
jgi:hypothetical protein